MFQLVRRYLAVSAPVEYHNSINSGKRWVRIVRYVLPVVTFSVAFNIPKFFELRAEDILVNVTVPMTNGVNVTRSISEVGQTEGRQTDRQIWADIGGQTNYNY